MARSIWRTMVYDELKNTTLNGKILDLGGYHKSIYHTFIQGNHTFSVANLDNEDEKKEGDFTFDFEKPFPTQMESFDAILCLNVLEHVFNYQNLLNESCRTLKRGGTMVLAVPFLIRYHPSPSDYWRYTEETLRRIFTTAGFSEINIKPIGTGVFGASYAQKHNFYRFSLVQKGCMAFAKLADSFVGKLAPHSTLTQKNYPLGYVVVAIK